ncbi:hypothetical protein ABZ926_14525 [Streptomyces litmocidini]|uniref:hypothetical protein n=1 Tax=Streptomyces litmocidini TaxID=67318 RepID=UPI0033C6C216
MSRHSSSAVAAGPFRPLQRAQNGDHFAEDDGVVTRDWLVQSSQTPGREWWAMWEAGGPYRIVLLPACTVENGMREDGEAVICGLYGCHGGDHDWS